MIRVEYWNFLNFYGRHILRYESFLTIFFLRTQQIESKIIFRRTPIPPLIFREHSLINQRESFNLSL